MSRKHRQVTRRCCVCGMATGLFLCSTCTAEMNDLLVGSRAARGAPGMVWYAERVAEQAYRQAKLAAAGRVSGTIDGYALLVDRRALDLLGRMREVLRSWAEIVSRLNGRPDSVPLSSTLSAFRARSRVLYPESTLEAVQARYLAAHLNVVAAQCADANRLRSDLMSLSNEARDAINPPPDNFCGPCPTEVGDGKHCDTILYANEDASVVRCDKCRVSHDVSLLRAAMREVVWDLLFTSTEILRLMNARLGDRMPKSSFHQLISDGRLIPQGYNATNDPLYTYREVCAARLRPAPARTRNKKPVVSQYDSPDRQENVS
jgi:hypothetical protein